MPFSEIFKEYQKSNEDVKYILMTQMNLQWKEICGNGQIIGMVGSKSRCRRGQLVTTNYNEAF